MMSDSVFWGVPGGEEGWRRGNSKRGRISTEAAQTMGLGMGQHHRELSGSVDLAVLTVMHLDRFWAIPI